MKLHRRDLRIDTFSGGGNSIRTYTAALRITHIPTGISVLKRGKSLIKLEQEAMQELEAILFKEPEREV